MILGDFGTTYCKFLDLSGDRPAYSIIPSQNLDPDLRVDMATGHIGKRYSDLYVNELIALARGGEQLIDTSQFVLLDCGSRDIKFIQYSDGKVIDMGWNAECGASMGFTIELLETYYHLDYDTIEVPPQTFSVTCGVLGMSHIFDAVIAGTPVDVAVAKFVKGIAINAYRFAGSPDRVYLSGGLCDNTLFVNSFPCETITLGRYVLLAGLHSMVKARGLTSVSLA